MRLNEVINHSEPNKIPGLAQTAKGWCYDANSNFPEGLDLSKISNIFHNINISDCKKFPIMPDKIDGDLILNNNNLKKLKGLPKHVMSLYIGFNDLKNLEGCPEIVYSNLSANENKLTSLKGAPLSLTGQLHVKHNKLTSFEYCPSFLGGGNFDANPIKSLKNINKYIKRSKTLSFMYCDIADGILDLLKIKNLEKVYCAPNDKYYKAISIVNNHLALRSGDICAASEILKCKAELEREGYGEYK